jgi:hypothetical protein
MRSPFFSESEGYAFVLFSIAAFAAIAVASLLGGTWAGIPAWGVVTAAAVLFYARRGRGGRQIRTAPAHVGGKNERRILVLVLGVPGGELPDALRRTTLGSAAKLLVVCPTPVSPLRHWTSDTDGARARAQQTLAQSLALLQQEGIDARGEVGDEDPQRAIEDALRSFGADEILVWSGVEKGRSVAAAVGRARQRFALPISQLQSPPQTARG